MPELEIVLEHEYIRYNLVLIAKNYTFNNVKITDVDSEFEPEICNEYEYKGKRYIRKKINSSFDDNIKFLDKNILVIFLKLKWIDLLINIWLKTWWNTEHLIKIIKFVSFLGDDILYDFDVIRKRKFKKVRKSW